MKKELPKDYFCPRCNEKASFDLVARLKCDKMPTFYIVQMALNILAAAKCPDNYIQPIWKWARTYGENLNELNEEEQDRLKLAKWRRWAG